MSRVTECKKLFYESNKIKKDDEMLKTILWK